MSNYDETQLDWAARSDKKHPLWPYFLAWAAEKSLRRRPGVGVWLGFVAGWEAYREEYGYQE